MIKAVFIDWYRTLVFSFFWEHLKETGAFDILQKRIFSRDNPLLGPWHRGQAGHEEVFAQAADGRYPFDFINAEMRVSLRREEIEDPRIVPLIRGIRRSGKKAVLATDNVDLFEDTVRRLRLDELFDAILDSSRLGLMKLDAGEDGAPLFFKDYMEANGVKPEETVLFDDNRDIIAFCRAYGMNAHLVDDRDAFAAALGKLAE